MEGSCAEAGRMLNLSGSEMTVFARKRDHLAVMRMIKNEKCTVCTSGHENDKKTEIITDYLLS